MKEATGMDASGQLDAFAPSADAVPAVGTEGQPARRFRGKNKNGRWTRDEGTELAVIRLPLDVHPDDEARLEQLFSAMWDVKRALQRDARDAVDAYWAVTSAGRATRRRGGGNSG
jgi:hypothetical protein